MRSYFVSLFDCANTAENFAHKRFTYRKQSPRLPSWPSFPRLMPLGASVEGKMIIASTYTQADGSPRMNSQAGDCSTAIAGICDQVNGVTVSTMIQHRRT